MSNSVLLVSTFVAAISGGYECHIKDDPTPLRVSIQQSPEYPEEVLMFGGLVKLGFVRKARTYHPDYEVWTTSVDMSREIELHVSKSQATFTILVDGKVFAMCAALPTERKALDVSSINP